ncbi:AfsR/SARP family transcriptional regulator [Streptomyces sp. HNM0575]|uniref:BTAD domain-containing putative transcriptional regulator n=1 Tax=Streptomyces sp. HNM0575 TaxID=2716338 RepID=UPI00145D9A5D|nr:AfsR/SARP family transcriptional regulator [Streptomyces sp. HNM0575]
MRYRYLVLGTTQVLREDGTAVPLGGARLRALLAALAAAGGRPVRTGALAAEVWAEGPDGSDAGPPADETAAVQALVGRLRRALGRDAIVSDATGYRLAAGPDDIDLFRFERLADQGAAALSDGEAASAARLLDEALALWRGPALADLPGGGGAAGVRAVTRALAARRGRLEAELALGRAESSLPGLRELLAEHPLDEPLHVLHLRALRDAGRPAEALAAYEEVRTSLADRLGTDPGPELRALHAELLAPERVTAPEREQSAPARPARAPLAPPEPRSEPEPTLPPEPSPLPEPEPERAGSAGTARRGNLRARLTSFVGRDSEIEALRAELAVSRLVTLTGPGGAGKTRLSQETAGTVAPELWPDGVWIAELAPVRDPAHLAETVLTALGGRETVIHGSTAEGLRAATDPGALDPLAQLAERCATRRMLLVLDNCEHLIEAAAELAETLLLECPHVTVLATSREPLGVPGESVRPVEPLSGPMALRLLAERGASARPGFRTGDDPEACAEICRRLDGLPLAIELAAARLRALSPRQVADRLDDRFRLLTSGSRTVLPRQQTLRAVVDWSWELLDEAERAVLRRLSVCSGGCELVEAEEVCGDADAETASGAGAKEDTGAHTDAQTEAHSEEYTAARADAHTAAAPGVAARAVSPRDVAALLGSLVDKSLVVAAPGVCGMRYALLETVAEYAAERLDEVPGERALVERRHLVAYRELARTTDPLLRGPDQSQHFERLERDHDNIRAVLARAVAAGDEHEALCLVTSMSWFWQLRDHRADARTWTAAAAALGPDPFAEPLVPAPPMPERCTDSPPPMAPDVLWEARRGVRLMELTGYDGDRSFLEDAERMARLRRVTSAYTPGSPQTCRMPGCMWVFAWMVTRPYSELMETVEATVEGCRRHGYEWELAFVLQLRGRLTNDRADGMVQSALDADESLEIYSRIGDCWGMADALAGRAEGRCTRGEFAEAAADYRRAISCARQLGSHGQIPFLLARLGMALLENGDPADAEEGEALLRQAYEDAEHDGRDEPRFATLEYAKHLGRKGAVDEAREILTAVEKSVPGGLPRMFQGVVQGQLAWLDCLEGEYEQGLAKAADATEKTRDKLAETIAPGLVMLQCMTAARALAGLGDPETAGRLLGAYDVHTRLPEGHHANPAEREWRETVGEAVRDAFAERGDGAPDAGAGYAQAYAEAYAEGGGLSVDEAAALVRRARPRTPA